jgi:hypothetical protein
MRTHDIRLLLSLLLLQCISPTLEGCAGRTLYLPTPAVQDGRYVTIINFSDRAISPDEADDIFLLVARLMNVTLSRSRPRPHIHIVSPTQIQREYLRFYPYARTGEGIAVALYLPALQRVLLPYFDRTILAHELAHYFVSEYFWVPRSQWEEIAEDVATKLTRQHSLYRPHDLTSLH